MASSGLRTTGGPLVDCTRRTEKARCHLTPIYDRFPKGSCRAAKALIDDLRCGLRSTPEYDPPLAVQLADQ